MSFRSFTSPRLNGLLISAAALMTIGSVIAAANPLPAAPKTIGQLIQQLDAADAVAPAKARKVASKAKAVRS